MVSLQMIIITKKNCAAHRTKRIFSLVVVFFADLPDDHPRITGVNEQYEAGEGITATCTAWHSNPPANLSWFINGEPVSLPHLKAT